MNGNIVGEEFDDYVFNQISQRQTNQYAGYETPRTPEQIQYLNNTTSWVKLASGVKIGVGGDKRLRKILEDESLIDQFLGTDLAKSTILFNGLSETDPAVYNKGKKVEKISKNNLRSGYSKTQNIWDLTSAYGLGGPEYGQQPMPGIQSVSVKSLNRGSIREANVKIKAYNKTQFAILEFLYLRIGFSMMLEWGNDKFINNKGEFQKTGNTIIEDLWFQENEYTQLSMIEAIERYRGYYDGNYDGFFGKVVNFTWTFGSDGSYDIDLKLITVGDIIESLQANVPVNSSEVGLIDTELSSSIENNGVYQNLAESSIVNAAQNNKIGKYLFTSIADKSLWDGSNPEYFSLKEQNISTSNSRGRNSSNFQIDKKINDKYNYFITFGELLNIFQNNCIPGIETSKGIEPLLEIESDENANKISYYPNQTSLDPRICIFNYVFGSMGEKNPMYSISGITQPPYLQSLKPYVCVEGTDVIYGKLMNIYLNYDFIAKCLISNTKDGKLSMYKLFQKICDGLNSSLGGVNNIEPIIKKDKIVTFIDQNPIPGYLELIGKDKTVVDLEVYGYNQSNKSSNFVKDISFKTEITPQLASMITIGGGGGKSEDGTAFSYWNEGLIDRFLPKIKEPKDKITPEEKIKEDRIIQLIDIFNSKSSWRAFIGDDPTNPEGKIYKKNKYKGERRGIKYNNNINGDFSCREFVLKVLENDAYLANNKDVVDQTQLANEQNNNYALYLAEAFGGSTGIKVQSLVKNNRTKKLELVESNLTPVPLSKSKYTLFDSKFINRAKSTYTVYINTIMKAQFDDSEDDDDGSPSNQVGFIPVGFGIQLQGISGIKIYNKLNINNTFLPSQYPKALKFLVKSVNHQIENNTWTTNLDTISIPHVKKVTRKDVSNFLTKVQSIQVGGVALLPEEERGPLPPTSTTSTKINFKGTEYTWANAATLMNPDAQPTFKLFFKEFQEKWDGYTMQINAIDRTIQKSIDLKKQNPDNAAPGYSKHNYSAAMDCNIFTPSGKMLSKKGMRNEWINQGFQQLAQKHNIEWGGNFATYEDCVHFAYNFNINTAVSNATALYGSAEKIPMGKESKIKLT
jgi:hypothetical protein